MIDELADYDPGWRAWFESIRDALPQGLRVEHVGSTSVVGMLAKPAIDLDVVVDSAAEIPATRARLEDAGWPHEGDLGVEGRAAFEPTPELLGSRARGFMRPTDDGAQLVALQRDLRDPRTSARRVRPRERLRP